MNLFSHLFAHSIARSSFQDLEFLLIYEIFQHIAILFSLIKNNMEHVFR